MANVHFEGVTKRFGDVAAVNNLTLEVADKEFLVLVGPSGCGKTTALRMLAGLEETTEGTVSIGSRVVNDVPPKDRDIAMVFQSYALYPHMSVYDNMAFGLKLRKIPKDQIKERVGRAAKTLGIEMLLDRKPKQLSGGQRQRVAVGRAIVREPSVFLFDEPLSNLDAKLRVQTRAEISKLHQQLQTTFIYVRQGAGCGARHVRIGHQISFESQTTVVEGDDESRGKGRSRALPWHLIVHSARSSPCAHRSDPRFDQPFHLFVCTVTWGTGSGIPSPVAHRTRRVASIGIGTRHARHVVMYSRAGERVCHW